jgi:hypothetical protein
VKLLDIPTMHSGLPRRISFLNQIGIYLFVESTVLYKSCEFLTQCVEQFLNGDEKREEKRKGDNGQLFTQTCP